MLFTESGEDEVGVGDGEKVTLSLGALLGALAPDAAGADGDQRLADLVDGAFGVVVRVDEAGQTCFLVGLEQFAAGPDTGDQHDSAGAQDEGLLEVDAAEQQAGYEDRSVGEGRAEVRLLDDHQHGDANQGEGLEYVFPGEGAAAEVGKVTCHSDDQYQLDPFRRLEMHRADLDPAPRTEHLLPDDEDDGQGGQTDAVCPGHKVDELVIVDTGKDGHGNQAGGDPVDLLGVEAGGLGVQGGGVDFQHRDGA